MTIETGALEQAYADVEASYNPGTPAALADTDGIRHIQLALTHALNREPSPEKRGTPDVQQTLPRRFSQEFDLSEIMWEPSGSLGTPSNIGKFIRAGMGAENVANLSTTIAASPTTTGATLTSGTGLAVGDIIVITYASDGHMEVTRLKTVAGADVTYDLLSAAPAIADVVESGVNYKLASGITESLAIYKYYNAGGFEQACYGCVVDQMEAMFDGTREVMMAFSGPAGQYGDSAGGKAVQAKPGSHTTVGTPVGGMVGGFWVDGVAELVSAVKLSMNNQLVLRNKELGTAYASGIGGRNALREVNVEITLFLEDLTLWTKAHSNGVAHGVLRLLVGDTSGTMVGMVAPNVEFEIPDVPGDIGLKEITVQGICLATDGNDQFFLAEF